MKIVKTRSLYSNQNKTTIVQIYYGAKLNLHNGSKFWRKKLIWFQNFYYIKKAAILSNFCLIGKIPHDFLTLTSIELACKTFIGIQVRFSVDWITLWNWTSFIATRDHALEAHSETVDLINETIVQCIVDEMCDWKSPLNSDTLSRDFLKHLRYSLILLYRIFFFWIRLKYWNFVN